MSVQTAFLVMVGLGLAMGLVYIATVYRFLEVKIESDAKDILLVREYTKHRELDALVRDAKAKANSKGKGGDARAAILNAEDFERILEKSKLFEQRQRLPGRGVGGYVYILHEAELSGLYKIGRTVTPRGRIGHFDTTWAFNFEIAHIIQTADPVRLESELHTRFWDRRKRGEWFALTPVDIAAIRSEYPS